MNYLTVFRALGPEVMLLVTAFVALTCDLILQHHRDIPHRMRVAGLITVVGLLGTILVLTQQTPAVLLGGTLVVNALTVIFKLVVIALTVLTVIISINYPIGRHVGEYFATLLFGAIGMLLLISAEELITIFVALELTSSTSSPRSTRAPSSPRKPP